MRTTPGGVAAKVHGGKLFVEREDGWEGPFEPVSLELDLRR